MLGKKHRAPLKQYVVRAPKERIAIDILVPLPETPRKNKFILVVGDYFTKWTESYPIPNQEATTVAEKLVSEFICHFGLSRELHSDQGTVTVQVVSETDSSAQGGPSRQRKPPSWYGTWVAG